MIEHGKSEGDAVGLEFLHPIGHHQPLGFSESETPGKKRGGVAVRPQAEQDQIEARELAWRQGKKAAQSLLVGQGCGPGVGFFGVNPEYILRAQGDLGQHGFIRHAVVAVGMVRRYVAFVAPEKTDFVPRD